MTLKPRFSLLKLSKLRTLTSALALLSVAFAPGAVLAESLRETLTAAYLFNPTLKAARAQLRATDNEVARAKAGYRPTITGTIDGSRIETTTKFKGNNGAALGSGSNRDRNIFDPRSGSIALQQNLFNGFRTRNAVQGAEAAVEAGREDLRSSEQNILLGSTTAYVNVVRDQAIVKLRQNNVKVLSEQLRATQDRFKVGEVTRTDVSQAQARLSGAQSDLSLAQANLQASRADYARLIGRPPGTLRDPGPADKLLPRSLPVAVEQGQGQNPTILAAIFRERAQAHTVKQIKGELLPSVDLTASYTRGFETTSETLRSDDTRVTGTVTVPIYQAGEVSARIRAAIETQSQRRQLIDEAREQIRADITSAWGQLTSARAQVVSGRAQVEATRIALQGVREEERVGQRTILDVLNAEQEFLNAQVSLASFRRDLVVASYSVLASVGRLSAYDVSLQAELYDPARYYGEVRNQWFGWQPSVETSEDPKVAPVLDPGRTPDQRRTDGPAYTQKKPLLP